MKSTAFLVAVLAVLASGCLAGKAGFIRANGPERAAFEFKCKEELQLTEINGSTVGVEGCGQSAVYKLVQTSQNGWDWIRDG